MSDIEILIQPDGQIKCLYTDLIDLTTFGKLSVSRASHVEFDDTDQSWSVRLADTKELIGSGFKTRKEALEFEIECLNGQLQ